jgi:hypothetical protein
MPTMNDNRFVFDATTLVDGFFPMPPGLSTGAAELLNRFLLHAVGTSPRLHVLDHKITIAPTEALEHASHEILRTKFPMPCEGCEESIATIDGIALQQGEIHFAINSTFAAYLLTAASCGDVLRKAMAAAPAPQPLPLDEGDRALVVESLQREHYFKTVQWNDHARYAVFNGRLVQPRDAFGLPRIEALLNKLGATTAP